MAVQIQLRRDTAASWTASNPVLAQGECGLELDTGKSKIGDGATAWDLLAYQYAGTGAALTADTDGTLAANSDTRVATQKATKTYVDASASSIRLTRLAVQTASMAVAVGDSTPFDTTSGALTATLPAAPADGSIVQVQLVAINATSPYNALTVACGGSDKFDYSGGATSLVLRAVGNSVRLVYRAASTAWEVVEATATYSAHAMGAGAVASGLGASAFGSDSRAYGAASSAFGVRNTVGTSATPVDRATAVGYANTANGYYSNAIGSKNTATGTYASALGQNNIVNGLGASGVGVGNHATGNYSSSLGYTNVAYGIGSSSIGAFNRVGTSATPVDYAAAHGYKNKAYSSKSAAFGYSCIVDAGLTNASAFGYKAHATQSGTFAVGDTGTEPRIVHVAAGTADTDAANVSQLKPSVQTVTSAATVTPTAANDCVEITAQAVALTIANPASTPINRHTLLIYLLDNGTARAITWGSQYRGIGGTLPSTTTASKRMYVTAIWNNTDSKYDVILPAAVQT